MRPCTAVDDNLVWRPLKIENLKDVHAIKGGEAHTLILLNNGSMMSCGAANYGMLGRCVCNEHYFSLILRPLSFSPQNMAARTRAEEMWLSSRTLMACWVANWHAGQVCVVLVPLGSAHEHIR